MSNLELSPDLSIAKYLDDDLAPDEAGVLLTLLQNNNEVKELFQRNLWNDFYLHERSLAWSGSTNETSDSYNDLEPDWDELVRLQNAERPISAIVDEYHALQAARRKSRSFRHDFSHFVRKCFWPSRADLEESIAPVITAFTVLIVLTASVIFFIQRTWYNTRENPMTTMARVMETVEPVWEDKTWEYKRGQMVNESVFRLKSGLVQLEMNNGTTLIMEGPTELTINSAMNAFCQSGRVSVEVPAAGHGYKISTPFGSIIDRGTEFLVNVTNEKSLVDVIKGQVDLALSTEEVFPLVTNQEMEFGLSGKPQTVTIPVSTTYISRDVFGTRVSKWGEELRQAKQESDRLLGTIPGLSVWLKFNEGTKHSLVNHAENGPGLTVYCKGTRMGEGAIPGSPAIEFSSRKDVITGDFTGTYTSMTLVARIRLDRLDQTTNVLFASDGFRGETGSLLWQVLGNGAVQLHIAPSSMDLPSGYTSPIIFGQKNLQVWVTLAVVADAKNQRIEFYVDGAQRGRIPWTNPVPINPGKGALGNFLGKTDGIRARSFPGAISEFMIFDRPLDRTELAQVMFRGAGVERPLSPHNNNNKEKETEQ